MTHYGPGITDADYDRWAEDHGYVQYRCPGCHHLYHSDSGPVGNCPCGYMPNDETEQL
jgi:hypothetical protein